MKRLTQTLVLLGAACLLAGVVFYVGAHLQAPGGPPGPGGVSKAGGPGPAEADEAPAADGMPPGSFGGSVTPRVTVSVIARTAGTYTATVSAYGAAEPHYELTLLAQSAGRVTHLADRFEAGEHFTKGTTLAVIDDTEYRSELSTAKYNLANAELELLEAEREAAQARADWEAAGLEGEPDSPLTLYQPQVDTARAAVDQYRAAVENARHNLANTQVNLPFDALITERHVAPGSYLQAGAEVATVMSMDYVEISVALTARDWSNLPALNTLVKQGGVTIESVDTGQRWSGRVVRASQHLDEDTRQRRLVIAVDRPFEQTPALLPGSFVNVRLEGRRMDGLWQLPGSALSQRNEIWLVRADDTLDKFTATPVFSDADYIYVAPPADLATQPQRVLSRPLSSYVKGLKVAVQEAEIVEVARHD